jgi:hypothetical protein
MATNSFEAFASEVLRLWEKLSRKGCIVEQHPAATEEEVAAFERQYEIHLPTEYRQYLLHLCNGGGWLHGLKDFERRGAFKGMPGDYRKQFPHKRTWNLTARQFARLPQEGVDDAGYAAFWKSYFRPALIDGAIPVCEDACSRWYLLVVTGSERGKVWIDERGSESGIFPTADPKHRHLRFSD